MSEHDSPTEQFRDRSTEVGVQVHRTEPEAATERLASLCEPPTVAVPLPWPEVDLPEEATVHPTPAELDAATTGVTPAGAVADYGSLLLRSTADGAEPVSLLPERHVAVVHEDDVHEDLGAALAALGEDCREASASTIVATGPSATADMGDIVYGAHGPTEVEVLLLEERR